MFVNETLITAGNWKNIKADRGVSLKKASDSVRISASNGSVSQPKEDVNNYKLPVGEDTSPRALLANALETAAQNDIEKRRLAEYKSEISMLDAEEAKLHDLNEQIKELSFAKGTKDTKSNFVCQ